MHGSSTGSFSHTQLKPRENFPRPQLLLSQELWTVVFAMNASTALQHSCLSPSGYEVVGCNIPSSLIISQATSAKAAPS